METETRVIRISVRNLVEFVMRSGDLDNRRLTGARKGRDAGGKPHPSEDPEADGSRISGRSRPEYQN